MSNWKKMLCMATVVVLFTGLISGCGKGPSKPAESSKSDVVDLGGYEMVLSTLWEWNVLPGEGQSEIGDQIQARFEKVQKDYNCKITFRSNNPETILEDIATAVAAGDKYADFVHLDAPRLQFLRTKKILRNLNEIENLDATGSGFNKTISDIFTDKDGIFGIFSSSKVVYGNYLIANVSLLKRLNLENPQKYVANRTWTFDKFREYLINCTRDTDGDGEIDVWGLTTGDWHANDFEKPMIWSNGGAVLKKDSSGKLVFALNDSKAQTALNYLHEIMFIRKLYKDKGVADYLDGKVAFLANNSITETHLIHLEDDYTLLPMPIGPDAKEYVSLATITAWGATTANKKEDMEKAAIIFKAFNEPLFGSVNADHEKWYDYYKRTNLRDDESVEALKILAQNTQVDISMGVGEISILVGDSIYSCTKKNEKTPKAAMEAIAPEVQAMADEVFAQQ